MITNKLTSKPKLLVFARKLRKSLTPAETFLWNKLKSRQVNNVKFRRQYPLLCYILDFYSPQARLAVEIDGSSHNESKYIYDLERQSKIEKLGIKVLRFTERDVIVRPREVLETIYQSTMTSPQSSP